MQTYLSFSVRLLHTPKGTSRGSYQNLRGLSGVGGGLQFWSSCLSCTGLGPPGGKVTCECPPPPVWNAQEEGRLAQAPPPPPPSRPSGPQAAQSRAHVSCPPWARPQASPPLPRALFSDRGGRLLFPAGPTRGGLGGRCSPARLPPPPPTLPCWCRCGDHARETRCV